MSTIHVKVFCAFLVLGIVLGGCVHGMDWNASEWASDAYVEEAVGGAPPHLVPLTLIQSAGAKGAVCLDGTLPAYHFDPGFGSGSKSWLVYLEGGGWCNDIRTCVYRKTTRRGSSNYMEKEVPFTGIMSNKSEENPDFYNWNRVLIRYCDGASFKGEGYNEAAGLHFRGQRIWSAAMEELMSKGMCSATQALLAGCSAGALAAIQHCDEFRAFFRGGTKVKCLADAGLFLNAVDVAGGLTLRSFFGGVARLQDAEQNLPKNCTSRFGILCFFPQYILDGIQTPTFLLNTAYDVWQIQQSLAPNRADPHGYWSSCKKNYSACDSTQIDFLQGFRKQMLDDVAGFSASPKHGLFINSCFAHCQTGRQDTWYATDSPRIGNKGIAQSVGDWYFERSAAKEIDCPYPCDRTCHNLVARGRA